MTQATRKYAFLQDRMKKSHVRESNFHINIQKELSLAMLFHTEKSPEEIQDNGISHDKEVILLLSTIFSVTNKKKNVKNWWNDVLEFF